LAALLMACLASREMHVLKGAVDGTKADADEASTTREAMEMTFMV